VVLRTLLLTVATGASLAIVGVAAAPAKDGLKISFSLAPLPPLTQTLIPMNCTEVAEGRQGTFSCHNTGGPNPFPPKDTKAVTFASAGGTEVITAYPDGQVTDNGTFKLPKGCPSLLACL